MAGPADFALIEVSPADIVRAKLAYARMGARAEAGQNGWAGFVAEHAVQAAVNPPLHAKPAPTLAVDLILHNAADPDRSIAVEIKTRVAEDGWTDPMKFNWLVVPTHAGREPVKAAAQMVLFCWYALEQRDRLWVLGYLRGPDEFRRRAVFYKEREPLPRGGWAKEGGAYAIDVQQLRPLPRGMLKEIGR